MNSFLAPVKIVRISDGACRTCAAKPGTPVKVWGRFPSPVSCDERRLRATVSYYSKKCISCINQCINYTKNCINCIIFDKENTFIYFNKDCTVYTVYTVFAIVYTQRLYSLYSLYSFCYIFYIVLVSGLTGCSRHPEIKESTNP